MAESLWTCPRCGPVQEILNGAGDNVHCLECDSLVKYNRMPTPARKQGRLPALPPTPVVTPDLDEQVRRDREHRRASDAATRQGRDILAAIEARQSGRIKKPLVPRVAAPTVPKPVEEPMPVESKYDDAFRAKVVELAKTTALSQREIGKRMTPAISQAQVSQMCREAGVVRGTSFGTANAKAVKVKPGKLTRPDPREAARLKRAEETMQAGRVVDGRRLARDRAEADVKVVTASASLEHELTAVGNVSRALEGLDEAGIRRVLGFALDRAAKRLGVPRGSEMLLLPVQQT